jgi:hypothetical protein
MSVEYVALRLLEDQRATIQELTLGGVRIILRSRYCYRTDRWYVSIFDTSSVLLLGSLAVEPGVDLLLPYKHLAIPQGQLFCHSVGREPPTFVTLDSTVRVLYR